MATNIKDVPRKCDFCGNDYLAFRNKVGKRGFCSLKCSTRASRPGRTTKVIGKDYVMTDGYIYTFVPNHPMSNCKGLYAKHRLTIEENIGRILSKSEVVHHIDGDVSNNNLSNLMLFSSNGEHRKFHSEQAKLANQNA